MLGRLLTVIASTSTLHDIPPPLPPVRTVIRHPCTVDHQYLRAWNSSSQQRQAVAATSPAASTGDKVDTSIPQATGGAQMQSTDFLSPTGTPSKRDIDAELHKQRGAVPAVATVLPSSGSSTGGRGAGGLVTEAYPAAQSPHSSKADPGNLYAAAEDSSSDEGARGGKRGGKQSKSKSSSKKKNKESKGGLKLTQVDDSAAPGAAMGRSPLGMSSSHLPSVRASIPR